MAEQDFISEIMGFNPSDLTVFQEENKTRDYDKNVYKTNPVTTKVVSEDGHYRSSVRVLYNPFDVKRSIVNQCQYVLRDVGGMFFVKSSLADGDKNCPLFCGWKKLHFSGDPEKDAWAKKMFERNESQWVLVQVIEDKNKPEEVGQFRLMKLPRVVYDKIQAKMNPSVDSKKNPVALMDYLLGPVLEMDVTPGPDDPQHPERKQREISYTLCDFASDPTPIMRTDSTPLFTDEEYETIDAYATAKANMEKARTEEKKAQYKQEAMDLVPAMKELYKKALDYLKENAPNLVEECGFTPWEPNVVTRVQAWLDAVLNMQDPAAGASEPTKVGTPEPAVPELDPKDEVAPEDPNEDLPF